MPAILALRSWRQEDKKFKVTSSYIMNSRPARPIQCDIVSKNKQTTTTTTTKTKPGSGAYL